MDSLKPDQWFVDTDVAFGPLPTPKNADHSPVGGHPLPAGDTERDEVVLDSDDDIYNGDAGADGLEDAGLVSRDVDDDETARVFAGTNFFGSLELGDPSDANERYITEEPDDDAGDSGAVEDKDSSKEDEDEVGRSSYGGVYDGAELRKRVWYTRSNAVAVTPVEYKTEKDEDLARWLSDARQGADEAPRLVFYPDEDPKIKDYLEWADLQPGGAESVDKQKPSMTQHVLVIGSMAQALVDIRQMKDGGDLNPNRDRDAAMTSEDKLRYYRHVPLYRGDYKYPAPRCSRVNKYSMWRASFYFIWRRLVRSAPMDSFDRNTPEKLYYAPAPPEGVVKQEPVEQQPVDGAPDALPSSVVPFAREEDARDEISTVYPYRELNQEPDAGDVISSVQQFVLRFQRESSLQASLALYSPTTRWTAPTKSTDRAEVLLATSWKRPDFTKWRKTTNDLLKNGWATFGLRLYYTEEHARHGVCLFLLDFVHRDVFVFTTEEDISEDAVLLDPHGGVLGAALMFARSLNDDGEERFREPRAEYAVAHSHWCAFAVARNDVDDRVLLREWKWDGKKRTEMSDENAVNAEEGAEAAGEYLKGVIEWIYKTIDEGDGGDGGDGFVLALEDPENHVSSLCVRELSDFSEEDESGWNDPAFWALEGLREVLRQANRCSLSFLEERGEKYERLEYNGLAAHGFGPTLAAFRYMFFVAPVFIKNELYAATIDSSEFSTCERHFQAAQDARERLHNTIRFVFGKMKLSQLIETIRQLPATSTEADEGLRKSAPVEDLYDRARESYDFLVAADDRAELYEHFLQSNDRSWVAPAYHPFVVTWADHVGVEPPKNLTSGKVSVEWLRRVYLKQAYEIAAQKLDVRYEEQKAATPRSERAQLKRTYEDELHALRLRIEPFAIGFAKYMHWGRVTLTTFFPTAEMQSRILGFKIGYPTNEELERRKAGAGQKKTAAADKPKSPFSRAGAASSSSSSSSVRSLAPQARPADDQPRRAIPKKNK